jgi:N-acetylglucosaminyldiphosphoundecaprenol N-acetyl-beta-D-mannosaminyltransferase
MVRILDVKIFDKNIDEAVTDVIRECLAKKKLNNYCISATGAHGLVYAYKNPYFKIILNDFYINLPDGMPNVWVGWLRGASKMQRCPGPDFFASLMKGSSDKPIQHFFCGGKEGVAAELKKTCENKFGNHKVVGVYSPPFREMTDEEMSLLGQEIIKSKADIVWIGLSTPKQERFATRLKSFTKAHFIITVGAAFDFHTGRLKKAPVLMQKSGTEWIFRLIMEPKRLYRRYLEIVPLFIAYNVKDFINTKNSTQQLNKSIKSKQL